MSKILAIDPGPTESGYCVVDVEPFHFCYARQIANGELRDLLGTPDRMADVRHVVIEGVESYGMAVGREVFETVFWSGRFFERVLGFTLVNPAVVYRKQIKVTVCSDTRANDGNIRTRLLDVFGGKTAKGTKKTPGPLFGLAGHGWAALALALTYRETRGLGTIDDLAAQFARGHGEEVDRREAHGADHEVPALPLDE